MRRAVHDHVHDHVNVHVDVVVVVVVDVDVIVNVIGFLGCGSAAPCISVNLRVLRG